MALPQSSYFEKVRLLEAWHGMALAWPWHAHFEKVRLLEAWHGSPCGGWDIGSARMALPRCLLLPLVPLPCHGLGFQLACVGMAWPCLALACHALALACRA
ncbi:unnamed protein product, partial [Prunus brigantina]